MTTLPPERVGPYLRALQAGVHALAPDADHVPSGPLSLHLHALDPAVSGPLLLPAALDPGAGLPALAWMDRVRAEREAASQVRPMDPARVEAIRRTDPELAERLMGRMRLLETIGTAPLVPELGVSAVLVRRGDGWRARGRRVRVAVDRRIPGIGWARIRLEVEDPGVRGDLIRAVHDGGEVELQQGFSELLARHVVSPLGALHRVLEEGNGLRILRLSRGVLGPFWFPGGPCPEHAPSWVRGALVLHASVDVIGAEVRMSAIHDPFETALVAPVGEEGRYRGRRLAVSPHCIDAARQWMVEQVGQADVVALTP